ncbi:MAG: alpha-glucosidase C-terminal domain-containing protein [Bacteroidales bacterium]|nr:alpha-glucosidase C-terminal domain-containing protein [Bacteroidales bacterium]
MKTKLILLFISTFVLFNLNCTQQNTDDVSTAELDSEFVPQWAKSVVWYQIFPERFRNGDSTNNPTVKDIMGADPVEPPKSWNIHPWGSDWYELLDYEKTNGEKDLWKHLLRRRYGGDLQGVIDKLDYLKNLGISAIYLNPVFDSPSLHKYDAASYHHIDPNFGPDPVGDRQLIEQENPINPETWVWTKADKLALQLIEEAHKRDIRIIFDGVFNHVGINCFAFKDLLKNQQQSAYKDWFTVKSWDNPETGETFDYEGWFGVKSLPEFKEDSNGIVSGPRDYIFNITKRWMNPNNKGTQFGIDGWRLDVAFCVGHPFWKEWRKLVRSINPEAYLTAEIVSTPDKVIPYMQGDEFDGEMNYNFAFTCAEFFFNPDNIGINAAEFDKKLRELRELYPKGVAYVCQNLFNSHDVNRIGSYIVNRGIGNFRNWGEYYGLSKAAENPEYSVRKPNEEEIKLQKLFIIMQMTYVGAPMIYYGDEVGMWGANDPDCRKPMVWDDIQYADEVYNPDGSVRNKADKVEINYDLFAHYKKLIQIRNNHKALQLGDFKTLITDDKKEIYAFSRNYKNETVIVVLNNSNSLQDVTLELEENAEWKDLLNDTVFHTSNKKIELNIDRKWGVILTSAFKKTL